MPIPLETILDPIALVALEGAATDQASLAARGLSNLGLTVHLGEFTPWRGGSVTGVLQGILGHEDGTPYDAWQGSSNIQAEPIFGAAEVFLAQEFGDVIALRGGRIDGGGSFGVTQHGADFVHASVGVSPTMAGIPTFPEPDWGGEIEATPVEAVSLMGGVYARESSPYFIGQFGAHWAAGQRGEGRAAAGAWHNGDGTGAFAVVDQQVVGLPGGRGLTGFVQIGLARPLEGGARAHAGSGLVVHGPLLARSDDAMGAGASWVALPEPIAGADGGVNAETIAEIWYEASIVPQLAIRLDLQGFLRSTAEMGSIAVVRTQFSL